MIDPSFDRLTFLFTTCVRLLILLPSARLRRIHRRTPHQAPTLIGCWFLKINPHLHSTLTTRYRFACVAASAAEKRDYGERAPFRQPPFSLSLKKCWCLLPRLTFALRSPLPQSERHRPLRHSLHRSDECDHHYRKRAAAGPAAPDHATPRRNPRRRRKHGQCESTG